MNPTQPPQRAYSEAASPEASVLRVDAVLEHIYISPGHDYWGKRAEDAPEHGIRDVPDVRAVEGKGLEGDRYFQGRANRLGQVTFFEAEVFDAIREQFQLPALSPAVFRRNLIVRGIRLRGLMGRRFVFQGVTFEGSQECKPCVWMDRAVAMGAQQFMREPFRGGLRARVCSTGVLRVNPPT